MLNFFFSLQIALPYFSHVSDGENDVCSHLCLTLRNYRGRIHYTLACDIVDQRPEAHD